MYLTQLQNEAAVCINIADVVNHLQQQVLTSSFHNHWQFFSIFYFSIFVSFFKKHTISLSNHSKALIWVCVCVFVAVLINVKEYRQIIYFLKK